MFYVYILKNPITDLPFYVGVGKEGRKSSSPRELSHISEATRYRDGKITKGNKHKIHTILKIVDQNLTIPIEYIRDDSFINPDNAFKKEIELIAFYGRRDIGTGILTNMTDGGEGVVNPSPESREKASQKLKGRPSHAKGVKLGKYSEERKKRQKEKMAITRQQLTDEEKRIRAENRRNGQKGRRPPWNKGLTKEDPRVAAYAEKKTGRARPDLIGKEPWNKGKKCPALSIANKGRVAHNKGKPSPHKGKSYEEIYGPEKAAELRELRRLRKIDFWQNKNNRNNG